MNENDFVALSLELVGQISSQGHIQISVRREGTILISATGKELGLTSEETLKEVDYGIRKKLGKNFRELARRYQTNTVAYFTENIQLEIDVTAARERTGLRRAGLGKFVDGHFCR